MLVVVMLAGCGRESTRALGYEEAGAPLFVDVTGPSGVGFRHNNGMSGEFYLPRDHRLGRRAVRLRQRRAPRHPRSAGDAARRRQRRRRTPTSRARRAFIATSSSDGCRRRARPSQVHRRHGSLAPVLARLRHGRRRRRLSTTTATSTCSSPISTRPTSSFATTATERSPTSRQKAGVAGDGHWGSSATFFDFDRDGLLDLYVANYVDYTLEKNQKCFASTERARLLRAVGVQARARHPLSQPRRRHVRGRVCRSPALRARSARASASWRSISTATAGRTSTSPTTAIRTSSGSTRRTARSGTKPTIRGIAPSMPTAWRKRAWASTSRDFDGNGTEDIFLTHLTREKSTLFFNRGEGYFEDRSVEVGVAAPSIPFTGFGTAFLDYDNDGWLDIVAANGAVHLIEELRAQGRPVPLHQKKQLFHNLGNGKFEEIDAGGRAGVRAVRSRPRPRRRRPRQRRRASTSSSTTTMERCACSATRSARRAALARACGW